MGVYGYSREAVGSAVVPYQLQSLLATVPCNAVPYHAVVYQRAEPASDSAL